MKNSLRILIPAAATVLAATQAMLAASGEKGEPSAAMLASPDGRVVLMFELDHGVPFYSATFKGAPMLRRSALGFQLKDGSFRSQFEIKETRKSSTDETWEQPWGEHRQVHNRYGELAVTLQETNRLCRTLRVVFRTFDHAVAFRYEWPEQSSLAEFEVMEELTEFVLASDPLALWQPALRPAHAEQLYARTRLSELLRQTRLSEGDAKLGVNPHKEPVRAVTTPLTLETDDGIYLVIHEANLTDYAGMHLAPREGNTLQCHLTSWSDGVGVKAATPFVSPWRFIMISDRLSDIVELTAVTARNVNPPNRITDTSWIQPGKYVGIWWPHLPNASSWASITSRAATWGWNPAWFVGAAMEM